MAKTARKFLVRRSKDNLSVVFARRARRLGAHPLGNLQAVASTRTNRINILNTEETEIRGEDYFEIKNIHYGHWWTRNWRTNRTLVNIDIRVGAHTSQADVITELNNILGYTIETQVGDEAGSGLSSVGGTSVVSFRLENVNYALEDGEGFLLDESSNNFVSEELNTVIQRSDGTFLSVDTRSVSHGGGLSEEDVDARVTIGTDALVGAAPGALDTLDELASALGDDANFSTTVTTSLATKAVGPSSSTDNAIVRYDGTTGKLVQDSGATLSDAGLLQSTYLQAGQFYLDTNGLFLIFRNGQLRFEGATENNFETSFKVVDPTADRTILLPDADGTLGFGDVAGPGSSTDNAIPKFDSTGGKTLQNSGVTIDDSNNLNLPQSATIIFEGSSDDEFETTLQANNPTADRLIKLPNSSTSLVGTTTSVTLTNKTLTSPVINTGVSGTAILDEDNLASDSATQLATQQSIKAYVDANAGGGGSATYILQEDGFQILMEDSGSLLADEVHQSVSTGVVSGTDLILTMGDGKTVTIDATELKNLDTSVSISAPNWYQTYAYPGTGDATAGAQLSTLTPAINTGPWHYGLTLKRGSEFLFDHTSTSQARWLGIWGGSSTYDETGPGLGSYWTKSLRFSAGDQISQSGSGTYTSGFDLATAYDVIQGSTKLALVYDYSSSKLQLWERSTGTASEHRTLITTANDAEDGNPVTISGAYEVTGGDLPTFTNREHTWEVVADHQSPVETTWHDGIETDTVLRHGTALHPGEKMVTITPSSWAQQYFAWDYTGTATGQDNVENQASSTWRVSSQEKILEDEGYTINPYCGVFDTGDTTDVMSDVSSQAKISIRYHVDNSLDIYDEDNEEVILTKDANMDGTPAYLHMLSSGNTASNQGLYNWTFEPFAPGWYYHPASTYKPNQRYTATTLDGGSRFIWGEKMYPGQELIFQESMGGSGNTHIGVRNGDDTAWVRNVQFDGTYITTTTSGFDITTQYGVQNKWVALRYDYGDNKLKWYDIHTSGTETLITTATVACDGNAIRISVSGNNNAPNATTTLRYYGWEYVHTPTDYPQPWRNWRIDRPAGRNSSIKQDTTLRHRRGLLPGQYLRWTTAETGLSIFFGGWKSTNAASGLTNIEAGMSYWDWGFRMNSSEQVIDLYNMTFNDANEDVDPTAHTGLGVWADPAKGTTKIQLRYHASTNKIDLHDHTNNRIIATKDAAGDDNVIYLDVGLGNNTNSLADNFMGGGDVEVAASDFAPQFTTATNMGYGDDGIPHAGEMVKIDTAVAVGKRLIIYPDFWGLLEDMGGVASSGPAVDGTGWVANDNVVIGWQKASSPYVGTNVGSSNSGWDAAMYNLLRGDGTGHANRIAIYSPGNAAYTARDARVMNYNFTDLYYTFDRISTSSGRIMAFSSLALARTGITGANNSWYASDANYMDGNAQTLTLTSDNYVYVYSVVGSFTLPTVSCTELLTIPT